MKAGEQLKQLFEDGYNGSPWIDVTLVETLQSITAKQAAKKVNPLWHSIWEIVNHIISWRQNVLQRVQGKLMNTPADNYFGTVTDTSQAAWEETLRNLEQSQHQWLEFLDKVKQSDLEKIYSRNNHTYYKNIQGIIQHDVYHLWQIVLLAKL